MAIVHLQDRWEIETFLRRNTFLHIYSIGDLDDFFWPYTTWYGWQEGGTLRQVVLLFSGAALPTLLALADEGIDEMRELLGTIGRSLPGRLYAHLSEGLEDRFRGIYTVQSHGLHYKMGLMDPDRCLRVDISKTIPLTERDLPDLLDLYAASYPGHWFTPQMLETGLYFGIRMDGAIVSVAGVHVYSRGYRVAALGNITTHPGYRGKGLARAVTAGLCRVLLRTVDQIGLNVKADNRSAIACYRALGFERVATYEECLLEAS